MRREWSHSHKRQSDDQAVERQVPQNDTLPAHIAGMTLLKCPPCQVVSLLKRWLMGTHQGAASPEHLDYYLVEFTFRFNRRKSRSRGKLFFRLLQQAVMIEPVPYKLMIKCAAVEMSPDHKILGLHD
jgi:hypothetical protein